jgi:preprotein translocase subunit SecG
VTVPDPAPGARVRSTLLLVLGAIVCVSLVGLVILAETGHASPLGAVVAAIGSAALGALAAQLSR